MRIFSFDLDVNQFNASISNNNIVQNDNLSYLLMMNIKNADQPVDLTGCSAYVHFIRGDSTFISDSAEIVNEGETDPTDGVVSYLMPAAVIRKQGRLRGEVHIYGENASYRLTTPFFEFDVRGEIGEDSSAIGENDVAILQTLVADMGSHILKSSFDQRVHGLLFARPGESDNGKILAYDSTEDKYVHIDPIGTGTVTSVGINVPNIFSVLGSPVTASGILDIDLVNQNANLVFASPSSGDPNKPTFRALVAADIPNLEFSKITNKPTTLSGYGITDAAAANHGHSAYALSTHLHDDRYFTETETNNTISTSLTNFLNALTAVAIPNKTARVGNFYIYPSTDPDPNPATLPNGTLLLKYTP